MIHDNLADTRKVLNRLVYDKGGWTLHMLRAQIGTEAFWAGIRDYYRRYRDGNASTDDFRRVMEAKLPAVSSPGSFAAVAQPSRVRRSSRARGSIVPEDKRIDIELAQAQSGELYRLPLEISDRDDGAGEPRIEQVQLTERNAALRDPGRESTLRSHARSELLGIDEGDVHPEVLRSIRDR